jgi:ketosteroid isomerase-like protein
VGTSRTWTGNHRSRCSGISKPRIRTHVFFDRVADDVDWTVEGTHPLAGRYLSKQAFLDATFGRLAEVLSGGVHLEVEHLFVDGETAIVELYSTSTTNEGAPFANRYCWICRFDGDTIVTVRAYLDSTMVMYTVLRNETPAQQHA